ncbi:MAG: DUF1028 domain-containing protein [Candidatus Hydrothermae bacterium]|nr:DUF1028 domain-containing protein [Candidatus Hydrothermae bacterium]
MMAPGLFLVLMRPPVGTFSIVAMDPDTREWGVAVASRVLDVGYIVPWVEADVGAVATQALSNPYFGPWALALLRKGLPADTVLRQVLARDTSPEDRQLGIVDGEGRCANFTGKGTLAWAGDRKGPYVCVQGNILAGPQVVDTMLFTFQHTQGPLAERLLRALEAGEAAGGDRRGKQSAALVVRRARGGYLGVDDRLVDLRVVDQPEPVKELRRLYERWQYAFLAPAYLRLAREDTLRRETFLSRAHDLLVKALAHPLDAPEVYNALAWEFALQKAYPGETLKAARRALELAPDDPNIMDTYAEALYAAGRYREAVQWEQRALDKEPDNAFFRSQLEKFRKALQEHGR